MDLAYWVFPLGIVFAACKILFDCGRMFQKVTVNLRKMSNAKVEKPESAKPAAQAPQTQTKTEVPSDAATQALNDDPHVVIPFRGPVPKGDIMATAQMAANDTASVPEEASDADVASAPVSSQAEIDRKWAFYDTPPVLRRNPDWKPHFVEPVEPAEPVQPEPVDVAEALDPAVSSGLWDDYASMMRTDDGGLVPIIDPAMQKENLSLMRH